MQIEDIQNLVVGLEVDLCIVRFAQVHYCNFGQVESEIFNSLCGLKSSRLFILFENGLVNCQIEYESAYSSELVESNSAQFFLRIVFLDYSRLIDYKEKNHSLS